MDHNYHIEYENITLRPLIKSDIENLRIWRNDPQNNQYLSKIPYITEEMQSAWFERYLRNDDEICFAIVEHEALNRMVGSLSLHEFAGESCFLGKILIGDSEAHGRRIGVNASIAATEIAFEQMGIKSINLHVFKDNFIALKVYKDAGFVVVDEHDSECGKKEYLMKKEFLYAQHE